MNVGAVGIPWYRREDFDALRAMFADGEVLHDTFDEWLATAKQTERMVKKQGIRMVRVMIDSEKFPAWCNKNGLALDAKARSQFASEQAHKSLTK